MRTSPCMADFGVDPAARLPAYADDVQVGTGLLCDTATSGAFLPSMMAMLRCDPTPSAEEHNPTACGVVATARGWPPAFYRPN
jgi:hypothetical protein